MLKLKTSDIIVRNGKLRKVGRKVTQGSSKKKAIVTLAEGYSLNLFDQAVPVRWQVSVLPT